MKYALSRRHRLIVWDEPGLGESERASRNDYSLENLAAHLAAVIDFAGGRPAVLVGHSIGGMIIQTLCKISPDYVARRAAALVLVHTSYTNPVRTTKMAWLYTAIEKPVIVPLLYLTIALWPLVWALNWLAYLNGSLQRSTRKSSFAGGETREQVDHISWLGAMGRPDVLARGMLGMLGFDATMTLPSIHCPTLVVVGDRDSTTLPEAGRFIAATVPNARFETLSPARHLGLVEHHEAFCLMVDDFIAFNRPPSGM
jgi:pimeloyl-ACP methyl ester carboxylesterase